MTLKVGQKQPRTVRETYPGDESVVVEFRRLGAHEKTVIGGNAYGSPGDLAGQLQQPNVGVVRWEGIIGVDGNPLPYSISALDLVAEADPGFLKWFNGKLIDLFHGAKGGPDDEGKSDGPSAGSEADNPTTPPSS